MFKNKALWITIAIIVVLLFAGYSWGKRHLQHNGYTR